MKNLNYLAPLQKLNLKWLVSASLCLSLVLSSTTGSSQTTLFSENWASSSYATKGWTFTPSAGNWTGWSAYTPEGGSTPNAYFNWAPTYTNYSFSLVSPSIDGTMYESITLDYLLHLNNFSLATLEQFKVEYKVFPGGVWTLLENYTNAGGTFHVARTDQVLAGMGGTTFKIRFTAYGVNSYNINAWGLDNIIVRGGTPPPPVCDAPTEPYTDLVGGTLARLNWTASEGASTYTVISRIVGTEDWEYRTVVAPKVFIKLKSLICNTNYEWQVKAICADGTASDWTPMVTFTTGACRMGDVSGEEIVVYPNPATNELNIDISELTEVISLIQIKDMSGKLITELNVSNNDNLSVDISSIPSGIYLLNIQTGNNYQTMKFVKQ